MDHLKQYTITYLQVILLISFIIYLGLGGTFGLGVDNINDVEGSVVCDDPVKSEEYSELALSEPHGNQAPSTIDAIVTAYTTRPEEGTTCISKSGRNICTAYDNGEMLIACPLQLKIAEKIRDNGHFKGFTKGTIVEALGVKYECVDRMNDYYQQFDNYFDIYMGRGEEAVKQADTFGIQHLKIKIYDL